MLVKLNENTLPPRQMLQRELLRIGLNLLLSVQAGWHQTTVAVLFRCQTVRIALFSRQMLNQFHTAAKCFALDPMKTCNSHSFVFVSIFCASCIYIVIFWPSRWSGWTRDRVLIMESTRVLFITFFCSWQKLVY